MRWLANFYDFKFKGTATAAIGIHHTKAWLSQLVNFKNTIWILEKRYAIKFCIKFGKHTTETYGILQTAFGAYCMNQASVFEWPKRFKEDRESVRDDERHGRSNEVITPELIGQSVRVSRDLAPCDFCLFPKLTSCRYETIKKMKKAVTKVIDTPTQEDFVRPSRSCWNGRTSALQPEEITSKGTRV